MIEFEEEEDEADGEECGRDFEFDIVIAVVGVGEEGGSCEHEEEGPAEGFEPAGEEEMAGVCAGFPDGVGVDGGVAEGAVVGIDGDVIEGLLAVGAAAVAEGGIIVGDHAVWILREGVKGWKEKSWEFGGELRQRGWALIMGDTW